MHADKPFSQSCENNKDVILHQLSKWFAGSSKVLEVGSGTGQHAVHFAAHLPDLIWQCSDQPRYHDGINAWIDDYQGDNIRRPVALTIGQHNAADVSFDSIFTANTAHIMQKNEAKMLMQFAAKYLSKDGIFCQYGPFTQQGEFSSESNRAFDQKLRSEGYGGYRDIDELVAWATPLSLVQVIEMPANNLLLVWRQI